MKKLKFNKKGVIAGLAIASVLGLAGLASAVTTTAVNLGLVDNFVVFGYAAVTNVPTSVITGDLGLYPAAGSFYDGGVTQAQVTGTIYQASAGGPAGAVTDGAGLLAAKNALTAAYGDASGRAGATVLAGGDNQLGGQTLTPGIYSFSGGAATANLIGTLTLNGDGVYIFQSSSDLVTAASSTVSLIGGAQACNVFWTLPSSAGQFGVGTTFKGTVMAGASITDAGYSNIEGRLLASTGQVVLNHTTLWKPSCAPAIPAPAVSGGVFVNRPLIDIVKVPNPLALPAGPGSVTFNYTVTNLGKVAMSGVTVKDDKCSPVINITGDTNGNGMLDVGKSWTYSCTKTVTKTEMNTATVHGQAYGWDAYDTANATVVVGASLVPPLIHVVKVPNKFTLPYGGGAVSYAYNVTNPGTVPLSNVSIADNKCTGLPIRVVGHPGDLNKNGLLDTNETFYFTCATNLTKTTTNVATAEGHANGLTAIDYAQATVAVSPAKLPNTGFGPEDKSLMNILVPAGVLALLLSFYVSRRKRTV